MNTIKLSSYTEPIVEYEPNSRQVGAGIPFLSKLLVMKTNTSTRPHNATTVKICTAISHVEVYSRDSKLYFTVSYYSTGLLPAGTLHQVQLHLQTHSSKLQTYSIPVLL